jgi:hypothetical protein
MLELLGFDVISVLGFSDALSHSLLRPPIGVIVKHLKQIANSIRAGVSGEPETQLLESSRKPNGVRLYPV